MLDEVIEERQDLLDLFFLIAIVSLVASILKSYVKLLPLWGELAIIAALLLVFVARIAYTPLFSFVAEENFDLPLGFDTETDSFLVPIGGQDIATPVNRAYQTGLSSQLSEEEGPHGRGFFGDGKGTLYDLIEYGVLSVWSQAFRSGWDVSIEKMEYGSVLTEVEEVESRLMDAEAIARAFSHNRLFPGSPTVGEPELETEGSTLVEDRELGFHLPPETTIEVNSERDDRSTLDIRLSNKFVQVQVQVSGYSMGRGPLSQARTDPATLTERIATFNPDELPAEFKRQERFRYAVIGLQATIQPRRRRLLWPGATQHLRWAENLVQRLEDACDYPTDYALPVKVE